MLRRRPRHRHDHPARLSGIRRATLHWAAGLLATGLLAAGCGDGGNDSGSQSADGGSGSQSGDDVSKQAFAKAAIGVCATAQSDLQRVYTVEFGARQPSDAELIRFVKTTAIPNVERQLAKLRALPQPGQDQDRSTMESYYAAYERGIEQLKRDPALVTKPPQIPPAFKQSNRLAIEFGIPACVR
ncbi:MAG: hypothetical protein AABM29_11580 [Actinomycetota bacterium]